MTFRWERLLPPLLFAATWTLLDPRTVYGRVVFVLLGIKLLLALTYKPAKARKAEPDRHFVAAVIPFLNEDPSLLRLCLTSLLVQTRRLDKIHLIDDGSRNDSARDMARALIAEAEPLGIECEVTVLDRNLGKRQAQAVAFRACPEATIFVTVDSDTILEPNAIEEALKPFSDAEVMCVTGLVMALNNRVNLLTRLIHLRYINAFLWERAAYSRVGSVLCACGSLALYRADLIREHLDDFLSQRFLGKQAIAGDDRRLTNYALLRGRAVLQETAIARTAVPERISHFLREQMRWNKSFIRESLWVVQNMTMRAPAFWLTFIELSTWVVFTVTLLASIALASAGQGIEALLSYLGLVAVISYMRGAQYISAWRVSGGSVASRLVTFLIAPPMGHCTSSF